MVDMVGWLDGWMVDIVEWLIWFYGWDGWMVDMVGWLSVLPKVP
jgi:hypothetical protein